MFEVPVMIPIENKQVQFQNPDTTVVANFQNNRFNYFFRKRNQTHHLGCPVTAA